MLNIHAFFGIRIQNLAPDADTHPPSYPPVPDVLYKYEMIKLKEYAV